MLRRFSWGGMLAVSLLANKGLEWSKKTPEGGKLIKIRLYGVRAVIAGVCFFFIIPQCMGSQNFSLSYIVFPTTDTLSDFRLKHMKHGTCPSKE